MPNRSCPKCARVLRTILMLCLVVGALASCLSLAVPPVPTVIEPFEVFGPMGNTIYGQIRRPDPDVYGDVASRR